MVGHSSRTASGIKVTNRTRPSVLTIKTPVPEDENESSGIGTRSQAIISNDWRKRAGVISSPGPSTKRNKQSYDASDISISLTYEANSSFSGPQYRFPRDKKAPWEAVASAPGWQIPSSSPSTCGENELKDVTRVQLRSVNPVVTNVNGEDIAMANRFSFDVSVVDGSNVPPHATLGQLQRLSRPVPFRASSEDSDYLLVKLQDMLDSNHDAASSGASASSVSHGSSQEARSRQSQGGFDSAISGLSVAQIEAARTRIRQLDDEEARFQRMLGRLHQKPEARSSTHESVTAAQTSRSIRDPAIMALKVKDEVKPPASGAFNEQNKSAANAKLAQQLVRLQTAAHQNSVDSGYASNDRGHLHSSDGSSVAPVGSSNNTLRSPRNSRDGSQTKTLNPAAAEFKLSGGNDSIALPALKKLARQPLTNIFPDAMASNASLLHAVAQSAQIRASQQTKVAAVGQRREGQGIRNGAATQGTLSAAKPVQTPAQAVQPTSQPAQRGQESSVPGRLTTAQTLPRQMMPPPGFSDPMPTASAPSHPGLGVYQPATTVSAPVTVPGLNVAPFHTFPPTGLPVQLFPQAAAANINPYSQLPISYLPIPTQPATTTPTPGQLAPPPGLGFPAHANTNTNLNLNPAANAPATGKPQPSTQPQPQVTVPVPTQGQQVPPTRPYFPVTTKPRDHDPVKQQMYEAFLEWRKANEPGYHMKCKMRQANRVMRQCQAQAVQVQAQTQAQASQGQAVQGQASQGQQTQTQMQRGELLGVRGGGGGGGGGNGVSEMERWKVMAEKAKAAVSAAAARAEEERRRQAEEEQARAEGVREELRVKVRELSRASIAAPA